MYEEYIPGHESDSGDPVRIAHKKRERFYRILQARGMFRQAPLTYQAERLVNHYKSMIAVVLGMEQLLRMIETSREVDGNSAGLDAVLRHNVEEVIKHQELNLGAAMEDVEEGGP